MKRTRIMLAHRNKDLARCLELEVNTSKHMEWAGWATSKADVLTVCSGHPPKILLLDTRLHDASALETINAFVKAHSPVRIVGFAESRDPQLIKSMLRAGACGYILASEPPAQLLALVPALLLGKTILSGDIIPLLLE